MHSRLSHEPVHTLKIKLRLVPSPQIDAVISSPVPTTLYHRPGELDEAASPQRLTAYVSAPAVVSTVVEGTVIGIAFEQPTSRSRGGVVGCQVGEVVDELVDVRLSPKS
jgi:hypothetical protein